MYTALRKYRVVYRTLANEILGRPDFVIEGGGKKVAIFTDGCRWHACPQCEIALPRVNALYWAAKAARARRRDQDITLRLSEAGWTVYRFWGHDLTTQDQADAAVRTILGL